MGVPVFLMGESGSGKSTSLRNFKYGEICVFNIANKPLPFKGKEMLINFNDSNRYSKILKALSTDQCNCFAIDDSQYLLSFAMFDRAKEIGYQKFTDMAVDFSGLIRYIANNLPKDTIVYFLHHTEQSDVTGKTRIKTCGKMLDNQMTVEGLVSIVLKTDTDGKTYWIETANDGTDTVKSPMGMFTNFEIDNDLKMVDDTIRAYWELEGRKTVKPKKEIEK